jgi:hypothetical protein
MKKRLSKSLETIRRLIVLSTESNDWLKQESNRRRESVSLILDKIIKKEMVSND